MKRLAFVLLAVLAFAMPVGAHGFRAVGFSSYGHGFGYGAAFVQPFYAAPLVVPLAAPVVAQPLVQPLAYATPAVAPLAYTAPLVQPLALGVGYGGAFSSHVGAVRFRSAFVFSRAFRVAPVRAVVFRGRR